MTITAILVLAIIVLPTLGVVVALILRRRPEGAPSQYGDPVVSAKDLRLLLAAVEDWRGDFWRSRRAYEVLRSFGSQVVPEICAAMESLLLDGKGGSHLARRLVDMVGEIGDPRAAPVLVKFLSTTNHRSASKSLVKVGAVGKVGQLACAAAIERLIVESSKDRTIGTHNDLATGDLMDLLVAFKAPFELVLRHLGMPLAEKSRVLLLDLLARRHSSEGSEDLTPYLDASGTDEAIVLGEVFHGFAVFLRHSSVDDPRRPHVRDILASFATREREVVNRFKFIPRDDSGVDERPQFRIPTHALNLLLLTDRRGRELAASILLNDIEDAVFLRDLIWTATCASSRLDDDLVGALRDRLSSKIDTLGAHTHVEEARERLKGGSEAVELKNRMHAFIDSLV